MNTGKIIGTGVFVAALMGSALALSACGDGYSRTSVGISATTHEHGYVPARGDEDRDGVPNRLDRDRDGDGVPNRYDDHPNNPYRP